MAITERYLDVELGTGLNDGTSEANAWQSWAAAVSGLTTGQRLNVKNPSSRSNESTSASFATDASNTTPIHIRGYGSTIGDGTPAQFENFRLQTQANYLVESIDILNSDANGQPCFVGSDYGVTFLNCKGVKTGAGSQADGTIFSNALGGGAINCYAEVNSDDASRWLNNSSDAMYNFENGVVAYCIAAVRGNPLGNANLYGAIRLGASFEHAACAVRNLLYMDEDAAAGAGMAGILCQGLSSSDSGGYHIHHNTIHNFAYGINITGAGGTSTSGTPSFSNNLITACPFAFHVADTSALVPPIVFAFNFATDGAFSGCYAIDTRLIAADPYTDKANGDFSLNSAALGGTVCRARAATAVGDTKDIGAIQS